MKKLDKKILFLLILFFMPVFVSAASSDIFFDGFETDNFINWTLTGPNWVTVTFPSGAHSGSNRAEVKGNVVDSILLKEITTAGYQNIILTFWYKIGEGLEDSDHVIVEWSSDGSIWNQLEDFSNIAKGDWLQKSYSLPSSAANNPNFQFRFRATLGAATNDIFRLDDVYIKGEAIPSPTPTETQTQISTQTVTPEPTPAATPKPTPIPTQTSSPVPTLTSPTQQEVVKPVVKSKKPEKKIVKKEVEKAPEVKAASNLPLQAAVEQSLPQQKSPYLNYLIYALTIGIASVIVVLKLMKFLI